MLIEKQDVLTPGPVLSPLCDTFSSTAVSFHRIFIEHPLYAFLCVHVHSTVKHRSLTELTVAEEEGLVYR